MSTQDLEIAWPRKNRDYLFVMPRKLRGLAQEILLGAIARAFGSAIIEIDALPMDERPYSTDYDAGCRAVLIDPSLVMPMSRVRLLDRMDSIADAMYPDERECEGYQMQKSINCHRMVFPCGAHEKQHNPVPKALVDGSQRVFDEIYQQAMQAISDRVRQQVVSEMCDRQRVGVRD